VPFKERYFLLITNFFLEVGTKIGMIMFIQYVKEAPDFGHMLDTKGKDKLAEALAKTVVAVGERPVIENKVLVLETPEDLLE